MRLVKKTITIREDQLEWLENESYINLSKFIQKKLDEEMEKWEDTGR